MPSIQPALKMSFDQKNGAEASSHHLSASFNSNNPFRNRGASPNPTPRPVSRNPFLDDSVFDNDNEPKQRMVSQPAKLTGNAATLFDELTLEDKPARPSPPNRSMTDHSNRKENSNPRGIPVHRPSRSQDQANRQRAPPNGSSKPRPTDELDIFADNPPPMSKSPERRVRRNSDSSVMERKPVISEEERRRQERKRRERKMREALDKDGKPKKPSRKLDIIDQLDATSIYGTGLFHHDGPFDACNPNRNKKGSRRLAPMQAFPEGSLNNSLRGGPVNAKPDHSTLLMQNSGPEAFGDYSRGGAKAAHYEGYGPSKPTANVQSAASKVEPVHGEESMGLGTSTFLDGAPASRAAIQKSAKEEAEKQEAAMAGSGGGLGRKKSIAQKIRGISNANRREYPGAQPQYRSAEPYYSPTSPRYTPGGSKANVEYNPFFNEFGQAVDKNGAQISEREDGGRRRAPSIPMKPEQLERRTTSDSIGLADGGEIGVAVGGGQGQQKSGFLNRVRSLKGGPRRPKGEKPTFD